MDGVARFAAVGVEGGGDDEDETSDCGRAFDCLFSSTKPWSSSSSSSPSVCNFAFNSLASNTPVARRALRCADDNGDDDQDNDDVDNADDVADSVDDDEEEEEDADEDEESEKRTREWNSPVDDDDGDDGDEACVVEFLRFSTSSPTRSL